MLVVFIYGGLLWYIFPIKEGISWEGHLAGFITGLFLAFVLKTDIPPLRKFAWEQEEYSEEDDDFMRHFDEEGNFIEDKPVEQSNEDPTVNITYHYKKTKPEKPWD